MVKPIVFLQIYSVRFRRLPVWVRRRSGILHALPWWRCHWQQSRTCLQVRLWMY